jgi:hypothetical protein
VQERGLEGKVREGQEVEHKISKEERHFMVYAKKSMRWLYAMPAHSIAPQRGWQLCDIGLRRIAAGTR